MLHITWHPNNTTHQGNAEKNTNVCAQHHHHNSQTSPWNATEGPATLPEVFLCTNRHTRRTAKTQSTKTWLGTTDNTTHKRNPSWNRATRGQSLDRRGRQQGLISKQAITKQSLSRLICQAPVHPCSSSWWGCAAALHCFDA